MSLWNGKGTRLLEYKTTRRINNEGDYEDFDEVKMLKLEIEELKKELKEANLFIREIVIKLIDKSNIPRSVAEYKAANSSVATSHIAAQQNSTKSVAELNKEKQIANSNQTR